MSNESKIRRDNNSGYPKYDKFEDHEDSHTHQWGGYSRNDGRYYEGVHGENISEETKKDSGRAFKKMRGNKDEV